MSRFLLLGLWCDRGCTWGRESRRGSRESRQGLPDTAAHAKDTHPDTEHSSIHKEEWACSDQGGLHGQSNS